MELGALIWRTNVWSNERGIDESSPGTKYFYIKELSSWRRTLVSSSLRSRINAYGEIRIPPIHCCIVVGASHSAYNSERENWLINAPRSLSIHCTDPKTRYFEMVNLFLDGCKTKYILLFNNVISIIAFLLSWIISLSSVGTAVFSALKETPLMRDLKWYLIRKKSAIDVCTSIRNGLKKFLFLF